MKLFEQKYVFEVLSLGLIWVMSNSSNLLCKENFEDTKGWYEWKTNNRKTFIMIWRHSLRRGCDQMSYIFMVGICVLPDILYPSLLIELLTNFKLKPIWFKQSKQENFSKNCPMVHEPNPCQCPSVFLGNNFTGSRQSRKPKVDIFRIFSRKRNV
jgi:hypothetical protein